LTLLDLPFTYFASPLPSTPTTQQIYDTYINLHQQACRTILGAKCEPISGDVKSPISYNLGLTLEAMVLCPRTSEGTKIKSVDGEFIGPISLNGTVLGGTLLVKSEVEWDALRNDESRLGDVLKSIGIDSTIPTPNERL